MPRFKPLLLSLAVVTGLASLPDRAALAHGDLDEDMLAEFQEHLDDFEADVNGLVAEIGPIVDGHAAGDDMQDEVAGLIEHWEDVGLHGAIETRATITYPGIWQAIISLQQAVTGGKPAAEVAAAGERLKGALWQGFGAVRLAASQVGSGSAPVAEGAPASGPETVDHILADLDAAVAAYQSGDLKQAEQLIHDTYMTRFEGLEGELIEHDPDLVSSLEKDFNANLPLLMQQGAALDQVRAQLAAMTEQLEAASLILEQAEKTRSEVF